MKSIVSTFLVAILLPAVCLALTTSDPIITSWVKCNGTIKYSALADITAVYYTSTTVYVKSQGIPSYGVGPWTANPNTPSGQNFVYSFPATPTAKSGTKFDLLLYLGQIGAWSNGMAVYNPYDGFSYNSAGVWHRNALVWEGISFDSCLGHPDGRGSYHNHVIPKCLFKYNDNTKHSPIVGYAFDGYPIYGPYGYVSASNPSSGIKLVSSSYRTRSITKRDTLANGTTLTSSQYGPDVGGNYSIGSYLEDYEYVAGLGDLDECNGRFTITPEYPNGTYAYFTTVDSTYYPVYPFVMLCYYGVQTLPNGQLTVSGTATSYFDVSTLYSVPSTSASATTLPGGSPPPGGSSPPPGGSTMAGGSPAPGGSTMAGGSPPPGGSTMAGGSPAPGGSTMAGGSPAPGGSTTLPGGSPPPGGSSPAPGGSTMAGGSPAPGGSTMAGGSPAPGGTTMPGGSPAPGGSTMAGGSPAPGGSTMAGGSPAPGGSTMAGGSPAPGGSTMAGGSPAPGGSTMAGGSPAPGGTTMPGGSPAPGGSTTNLQTPSTTNRTMGNDATKITSFGILTTLSFMSWIYFF